MKTVKEEERFYWHLQDLEGLFQSLLGDLSMLLRLHITEKGKSPRHDTFGTYEVIHTMAEWPTKVPADLRGTNSFLYLLPFYDCHSPKYSCGEYRQY